MKKEYIALLGIFLAMVMVLRLQADTYTITSPVKLAENPATTVDVSAVVATAVDLTNFSGGVKTITPVAGGSFKKSATGVGFSNNASMSFDNPDILGSVGIINQITIIVANADNSGYYSYEFSDLSNIPDEVKKAGIYVIVLFNDNKITVNLVGKTGDKSGIIYATGTADKITGQVHHYSMAANMFSPSETLLKGLASRGNFISLLNQNLQTAVVKEGGVLTVIPVKSTPGSTSITKDSIPPASLNPLKPSIKVDKIKEIEIVFGADIKDPSKGNESIKLTGFDQFEKFVLEAGFNIFVSSSKETSSVSIMMINDEKKVYLLHTIPNIKFDPTYVSLSVNEVTNNSYTVIGKGELSDLFKIQEVYTNIDKINATAAWYEVVGRCMHRYDKDYYCGGSNLPVTFQGIGYTTPFDNSKGTTMHNVTISTVPTSVEVYLTNEVSGNVFIVHGFSAQDFSELSESDWKDGIKVTMVAEDLVPAQKVTQQSGGLPNDPVNQSVIVRGMVTINLEKVDGTLVKSFSIYLPIQPLAYNLALSGVSGELLNKDTAYGINLDQPSLIKLT